MSDDPILDAARYRIDRLARAELGSDAGSEADPDAPAAGSDDGPPPAPTAEQRAAYVEVSLQQAMRRGDFDGLPGAGKPIRDLGRTHDPDWWIRRKIEREKLTGLGPPALTLRTEHAELDARLDALHREDDVRQVLADFNARVVEARRQLQGGPPVVTPTRDVDAEVRAWRERRATAQRDAAERQARESAEFAALTWRERRRRCRA